MTLAYTRIAGPKAVSSVIKWELFPDFCREGFILAAGSGAERTIAVGQLLAMQLGDSVVDVASEAGADNTGDGTLTLSDPAFTNAVKPGDYSVVCTVGGTDAAAKFRVEDPEGVLVGTATSGTAFAKQVKFTIAAGVTDFVEGDAFTVTVTVDYGDPTNKIVAWAPDAEDGTEIIWGISREALTAPDGEDRMGGVADRRDCIIAKTGIVWPDGITDAQKAEAYNALEAMRLIPR